MAALLFGRGLLVSLRWLCRRRVRFRVRFRLGIYRHGRRFLGRLGVHPHALQSTVSIGRLNLTILCCDALAVGAHDVNGLLRRLQTTALRCRTALLDLLLTYFLAAGIALLHLGDAAVQVQAAVAVGLHSSQHVRISFLYGTLVAIRVFYFFGDFAFRQGELPIGVRPVGQFFFRDLIAVGFRKAFCGLGGLPSSIVPGR